MLARRAQVLLDVTICIKVSTQFDYGLLSVARFTKEGGVRGGDGKWKSTIIYIRTYIYILSFL